jgi:hypothetical protein
MRFSNDLGPIVLPCQNPSISIDGIEKLNLPVPEPKNGKCSCGLNLFESLKLNSCQKVILDSVIGKINNIGLRRLGTGNRFPRFNFMKFIPKMLKGFKELASVEKM